MTQRHEEQKLAPEGRREWTAPAVRRMSAGSAEDGANTSPDGGQPS